MGFPDGSVVKNLPEVQEIRQEPQVLSQVRKILGVGNGKPLWYFYLENPMDREVWQATDHRVAKESEKTEQLNKTKETKDLHTENNNILMREIKDNTDRRREITCPWIGRINIVKMTI